MIEAVYWRDFRMHAVEYPTVDAAVKILRHDENLGKIASVGVFVDGKPVLAVTWDGAWEPTPAEAREMGEDYAELAGVDVDRHRRMQAAE